MANLNQNWIIICISISLDDTWKKVTFLLSLEWGFALKIGRRFHFLTHKAVALNDIRGAGLAGLLHLLPLLLLNRQLGLLIHFLEQILLLSVACGKSLVLLNSFVTTNLENLEDILYITGSWAYAKEQHFCRVHVCMHTPTDTYTQTHTSLIHRQHFQSDCFPVFIKLPISKKSDTCKANFPLISFPECSVIPQGFMPLCKHGSVIWAKVTIWFMTRHKHWETKLVWSIVLSMCGDLGRGLFKDTPMPLNCCQLWAAYQPHDICYVL